MIPICGTDGDGVVVELFDRPVTAVRVFTAELRIELPSLVLFPAPLVAPDLVR